MTGYELFSMSCKDNNPYITHTEIFILWQIMGKEFQEMVEKIADNKDN